MRKTWFFIAGLPLLSAAAFGAGIAVAPSYVRFSGVELKGEVRLEKPAGYLLKIVNGDKAEAGYDVDILTCKEAGLKPNGGYEDFPDAKWLVFRSTHIAVPAGGTGYLPYVRLKAPKGDYAGKRWQLVLKVSHKGKEFMGAEAVLPLWIETKIKKAPKKATAETKGSGEKK